VPRIDLLEFRGGTAAQWTSTNPVLGLNEPGRETDTNKLKIGDGVTAWASLAYFNAAGAVDATVVHNTGAESIAGVKTFSASPIVPTPTTSGQATPKSYVDGLASAVIAPSGTDDTTAINAAGAAGRVLLGPGNYIYNGTGITNLLCHIAGAGKEVTFVNLGATSYFYNRNGTIQELTVKGITFIGGKGAIRQSSTGSDSYRHRHIFDCRFQDYTQCAISDLGSDTPYWKIRDCFFEGANFTTTIGVAIAGQLDATEITGCGFTKNRVHIKLTNSGLDTRVMNCDFFREGASAGSPRVDIWMVPSAALGSGGMVIDGAKFGPELLESTDYRIVIADQAAGTDFSSRMPDLTTASTGSVTTLIVRDSILAGILGATNAPPLVFTTTPSLYGCRIGPINIATGSPRAIVESLLPLATIDPQAGGNILGPVFMQSSYLPSFAPTNCPSLFTVLDPGQCFEPQGVTTAPIPGGGSTVGYVNLMTQASAAGLSLSGATKTNVTDAKGGTNAIEVTATSASNVVYDAVGAGVAVDGRPCFVEFDLKVSASSPMSQVEVAFGRNPSFALKRLVAPPTTWTRYRYEVAAQDLAANTTWITIGYPSAATITGTKFQVGRIRVYQAREPVLADLDLPVATTATSAPAAGGGSALPATPAGYVTVYVNGTARQIAYY
jgi:hypothetical protein